MLNLNTVMPASAICAVVGGAMLLASPSFANPADGRNVTISVDKRDLQTQDGVERVWYKLVRKAERVCETKGITSLMNKQAEAVCVDSLLESFINDVSHKGLTSFHLAHQDN